MTRGNLPADELSAVTGGANGGVWSPPADKLTGQTEPDIGRMDRLYSLLPYIEQK